MATATAQVTSTVSVTPKRKLTAVRQRTVKPKSVQTAIAAKRISGASKRQIARDLGIAVNTVTNIVELNNIDTAIEQYRRDAVALAPLAITAVRTDLEIPGNGMLGLRVLESVGVLGDNAIDTMRRTNARVQGGINVLVQSGATVTVQANDAGASALPNTNTNTVVTPVLPRSTDVAKVMQDNRTVSSTAKVTSGRGTDE